MILIYRLLTSILYPFFAFVIFYRKLINKEDPNRFKEKILPSYFYPERDHKKKLIWFHAASIGEVQSVFPVIESLQNEKKNIEFLITTTTFSASNIVKKHFDKYKDIKHRFLPLDIDFLIKSFLNKWKPNLALFVDSEIWPNFINEINKNKIPIILINGRITKKSFLRWMMVPSLAKKIFRNINLCLPSSKESEEYLKKLSVQNIKYFGNIKLSGKIEKNNLSDKNLEKLKDKKFWCAASTHKGEENFCLKVHKNLKKILGDIITIIIPRHITRSNEISLLCKKQMLKFQILNENEELDVKKEIIILNSFGSLFRYYKISKSVFIGKSMLKRLEKVGGQNPIEAAKFGCKIYHGPYVYNFNEIYDLLKKHNVSEEVNNDKDLSKKLANDFNNHNMDLDKIAEDINRLGNTILDKTIKEIDKFIK